MQTADCRSCFPIVLRPLGARPLATLEVLRLSTQRRLALNRICKLVHLTIDLPPDISEALQGRWGDVSRHALETLAVEAYRTGVLSENQVKRLLGFDSRFQVHALLKQYQVPLRYTGLDLEHDLSAHHQLGILRSR
jgi:hypothetical protein